MSTRRTDIELHRRHGNPQSSSCAHPEPNTGIGVGVSLSTRRGQNTRLPPTTSSGAPDLLRGGRSTDEIRPSSACVTASGRARGAYGGKPGSRRPLHVSLSRPGTKITRIIVDAAEDRSGLTFSVNGHPQRATWSLLCCHLLAILRSPLYPAKTAVGVAWGLSGEEVQRGETYKTEIPARGTPSRVHCSPCCSRSFLHYSIHNGGRGAYHQGH